MRHKVIAIAFLIMTLNLFGCASELYTQNDKDHSMRIDTLRVMKMQDVIALSKAGVSDSLIIVMMDATDSWFKLKTQDVLDLRNAGVSEKVISAMMQQPSVSSDQSSNSNGTRYYAYPPYFWYDGFYPYWSPSFSVRRGYHFHHRRFH